MKKSIIVLCMLLCAGTSRAQRYREPVFSAIDSFMAVPFGEAITIKGKTLALEMDIYRAGDDTSAKKPLLIFVHGGGFQNNTRKGNFSKAVCLGLAARGYVTATVDYRLGIEGEKTYDDYLNALYRAQQDVRAAVRFFRKNARQYQVDTSRIYLTGSSAGSKTVMAVAYWDESEVPASVNRIKWGSLEGESGNPGYSSKVHGVINCWGAMVDYRWIRKGDVPLFNIAGTIDKTVPYDSSFSYHGFKYGPYILFQHCASLGIPTGWRPFYGSGHTLDNSIVKQDSCIRSMAAWLATQATGNGSYTANRWDREMKSFDSLNSREKYAKDAVLITGSSFIRLWKNIRSDLQYSAVIHRGYGGSNSNDMAYYIPRILADHHPLAVCLYIGNDITGSEKDKSPDQVLEYFRYIVQQIRQAQPGIPIVWMEIAPSVKRWKVWKEINEANRLIREYCATQSGLYTLPVGDRLLKDGKPVASWYVDDQLHFNEEGYRQWGHAIRNDFQAIIKKIKQP